MFAVFGLGWGEFMVLGVIAAAILLRITFPMLRTPGPAPRRRDEIANLREEIGDLRAEIEDLRAEIAHLKWRTDKKDPPDGIIAQGNP